MKMETNCFPFYLCNGYLFYFQRSTKEIRGSYLQSHYWIFNWRNTGDTEDGHKKYYMQNYQLGRYWNCMKAVSLMNERQTEHYERLGKEALKNLNIDASEEAFRRAQNVSLTLTVEKLREEHEKNVLLGHIAAILGEDTVAQDFFKASSKPHLALELRTDVQDWNFALKLAKEYQPYKEPFISRKLAYQLESQENIAEAIRMYESSVISNIPEFLASADDDITKEG